MTRMANVLLLALIALGAGCGDTDQGDLLVRYRIGDGSQTCDEHGLRTISVTATNAERTIGPENDACQDGEGEVLVGGVPADVYTVTVEGLDARENATFFGEVADVRVATGTVTETRTVSLSPRNPGIRLIWGGGAMCRLNEIDHLELKVYFEGVSPVYENYDIDCVPGLVDVEDLVAGTYSIRLRAVGTQSNEYTFGYDNDTVELGYGQGLVQVTAPLEPCPPAGCTDP